MSKSTELEEDVVVRRPETGEGYPLADAWAIGTWPAGKGAETNPDFWREVNAAPGDVHDVTALFPGDYDPLKKVAPIRVYNEGL